MKSLMFRHILFALLGLTLLASGFAYKQNGVTDGVLTLRKVYFVDPASQKKTMDRVEGWMVHRYGTQNMYEVPNGVAAEGSFFAIARTFLGKNTKTCHYTYSAVLTHDSLYVQFNEIYFTWYAPTTYKGDRGGRVSQPLENIFPLEKKVPLEKKAYRQYLNQLEEHMAWVFQKTEGFLPDSNARQASPEGLE